MTVRRWLAASGAMVLSAAAAACATLPTSGSIQVSTLHGPGGSGQNGVEIAPVPPGRAWTPQQIVSGFLAASASPDPKKSVARQYLTASYSKRWRPGWAATIIDKPGIRLLTPPKGVIGAPLGEGVRVIGKHLARLQTTGRYQAGSVVVVRARTQFTFSLVQVSGRWRISGVEVNSKPAWPTLLLITRADFERDYQPRYLYFFAPGADSTALVPDPVYIPQEAGGRGLQGLVETLLKPHLNNNRSWLFGAAATAFPAGTKLLQPPQVVGGTTALVNVGGTAARATPDQQRRMAAQLNWSLIASPSDQASNPIHQVVLELNGRQVQPPLTQSAYMNYLPVGAGAPLYYQITGGASGPAVIMHASVPPQASLPLPSALRGTTFSVLAVSPAPVGSAVVAGCSGKVVYLIPQSRSSADVTSRRLPSACTALSWDVHGNLWVAAGTQIFEMAGATSPTPGKPALVIVQVPKSFRALRIAPDGVRAALIVRSASSTNIEVAAISKTRDFTYLAATSQMVRVGSDIAHPIALSWLDPDHLLVLDQAGPARTVLYVVPLNGAKSTEIPTPPGRVTAVTAGGQGQGQLVVVAIAPTATSPGRVELSRAKLPATDWQPLADGITPVFPG